MPTAAAPRTREPHGSPLLSTLRDVRSRAAEVALETLWPTRCAVCDAPGRPLCDNCRARLPYIDALDACPLCGAPHGRVQCTECNRLMLESAGYDALPVAALASAVTLDAAARRVATTYKDQGEQRLAGEMAALMARYVPPAWLELGPAVTYVPATPAARRRRGFDHGELLARELSWQLGCAFAPLLAPPRRRDQRTLGRAGRVANMEAALRLLPGATPPAALILADDVCTTGATLYACATALARAGAETVFGLTFARA